MVLEAPPPAMRSKPMTSFSDNEGSAMNSLSCQAGKLAHHVKELSPILPNSG